MSITILAPMYYPSRYNVRYLEQSAARYNLSIQWYGEQQQYTNWHHTQIDDLCDVIDSVLTTHILYTDSSDVIANSTYAELADNYFYHLNAPPILIGKEQDGQLCAGGWLAERELACDLLRFLKTYTPDVDDATNPQVKWRSAYAAGHMGDVNLDTNELVFQVADEPLEVVNNKVYNPRTQTYPCFIHFAGGYTDPVVGKAALIEPIWSQLGF